MSFSPRPPCSLAGRPANGLLAGHLATMRRPRICFAVAFALGWTLALLVSGVGAASPVSAITAQLARPIPSGRAQLAHAMPPRTCDHSPSASEHGLPVLKPGSPQWKQQVKEMRAPGGGRDCRVATQEDAERLMREGRGDLQQMPTYTDEGYKVGYEVHPNESHTQNAPHNDLPHIKWKDWSGGKKQGGSAHIFFG